MHIEIVIGEDVHKVEVPKDLIDNATEVFDKFDNDLAGGWQMSRDWVPCPNTHQRCQIIADRILTAVHHKHQHFIGMACAYIIKKMPHVRRVIIDIDGDITQTQFE